MNDEALKKIQADMARITGACAPDIELPAYDFASEYRDHLQRELRRQDEIETCPPDALEVPEGFKVVKCFTCRRPLVVPEESDTDYHKPCCSILCEQEKEDHYT